MKIRKYSHVLGDGRPRFRTTISLGTFFANDGYQYRITKTITDWGWPVHMWRWLRAQKHAGASR